MNTWFLIVFTMVILSLAIALSVSTLLVSNRIVAGVLEGFSRVIWVAANLSLLFGVMPAMKRIIEEFGLAVSTPSLLTMHVGTLLLRYWPATLFLLYGFVLVQFTAFVTLSVYNQMRWAKRLSAIVTAGWILTDLVVIGGCAVPLTQLTGLR